MRSLPLSRVRFLVFCFAFFLTIICPFLSEGHAADSAVLPTRPESFSGLADRLLPAVVNISSTQKIEGPQQQDMPEMPQFPPGSPFQDFFEEFMDRRGMNTPSVPATSLGSGFVIDAEKGLIVTNNHVIRDADEVRVTFHDDESVTAEILGRDEKTDLAVLKVAPKKKMTAVAFGNSDQLRVGDWVLAIGNPFGLGGTVTAGIVSARQRDINAGPYDDFIQTDASINRGNSGGPMFNLNGEVIGINTAIFSPSGGSVGIGFAIPSALAKPVIDQIIEFGRTKRGWLGVRIQAVTEDIAENLGLPKNEGALVASILPDSPAAKAGLKAGDVIVSFKGERLSAMRQLPRIVAESAIGSEVDIIYWRKGKEMQGRIVIAELEQAEKDGLIPDERAQTTDTRSDAVKVPAVGLTVTGIHDEDRRGYNIPSDIKGAIISEVDNMSEAAEKGLEPGDVIVEVNQQPIIRPQMIVDLFAQAQKEGKTSVLLLLNRSGDVRFVALKLSEKEAQKDKGQAKKPAPAE